MTATHISPFKFLDAYEKEDKDRFFGREVETSELYDMVFRHKLVLLYGVTGVGKTSLIRCGLANCFSESQWFALYLRRGNNVLESLSVELTKQINHARSKQTRIDLSGLFKRKAAPTAEIVTPEEEQHTELPLPVEQLKTLYQLIYKPIYLIFDQFEEIFTLGNFDEQVNFFRFLSAVEEADLNTRVIISVREEYLAYILDFKPLVPNLFKNDIHIHKIDKDRLKAIIEGTLQTSQVRYEAAVPQDIMQKIMPDEKRMGVELSYLQIYLDKLYREATKETTHTTAPQFTSQLVEEVGEFKGVMENFLKERLDEMPKQSTELHMDTAWVILKKLITDDGTKKPLSFDTLLQSLT